MTLLEAMTAARGRIDRLDARLLLQHLAGCRHADLLTHPETPLTDDAARRFLAAVDRRSRGEPLAYILGEAEFRGRLYRVSPATLVPRPETELLIDLALNRLSGQQAPRVLDLGTGSGIIAISLALENPAALVTAVDLCPAALAIATDNARQLGATVDFRQGNWYDPLNRERYHLIVANPPYIAADDPHLAGDGLPFEPARALTDGGDGLACIRELVADAPVHLLPGGSLWFEHGHDQGAASRNLLVTAGFQACTTHRDLAGLDRVSGGFI